MLKKSFALGVLAALAMAPAAFALLANSRQYS